MTKEQLVQKSVSDKRMKSLWGGSLVKKKAEAPNKNYVSAGSLTEYDELSKLNFYGSRRHTMKIDTTVPKIVRSNKNVILAPIPRSASKEELSNRRALLEMKLHEFMIED